MVTELKDTADKVFHNQFHRWRKRNPCGMFFEFGDQDQGKFTWGALPPRRYS